jgi:glycosyltransferase involved in cell wall biosynthesis
MKSLTVFTPTFNRAYCLHQLYESLCEQTSNDFEWLIIDDGSTDRTEELVESWINENRILIHYHLKQNGGMHTGHNKAIEIIETELNVCIDSDDYMPINAVEKIISFWNKNKDEKFAGILGLDVYKDGSLVSNRKFPYNIKAGKYSQLYGKYNLKGDIKFVYSTKILKKYPKYPVFKNENFVPLGYKYLLIDKDYDMLFLNEPLCVVDYLPDGSTLNIIRQYFRNPNGFLYERKIRMKFAFTLKERFTNSIHYISTCVILKKYNFLKESTNKVLTILAVPFGVILYFYLKRKL